LTVPFRAFISVDLPPLPRIEALARDLHAASRDLKVVSVEHLHLTLKFLGETEEGLVPEIVSAMRETSASIPPFTVRVHGTGAFPSLARPSVLWVGLQGAEPLARMAKSLDADLAALGFEPERRPWSPHITLARVRGGRRLDTVPALLRAHETDDFGEARVEELRLKKSVLQPGGPEYTTVEAVRLEG
jgi:2'-5' RNA ligase